jgi:hypothetical protein
MTYQLNRGSREQAHISNISNEQPAGGSPAHGYTLHEAPRPRRTQETTMTEHAITPGTMRAVRFHEYGEPGEVLHLETAPVPDPGPSRVRIAVHACGLNPADWSLCRGLFPGQLPRGIGADVSGIVDAVGEGVSGLRDHRPLVRRARRA